MPLTAAQQAFLNNYVRKHSFKGKGKTKRADAFAKVRDETERQLKRLPTAAPEHAALKQRMAAADAVAEGGHFNEAARQMKAVVPDIVQALAAFDPMPGITALGNVIQRIKTAADAAAVVMPAVVAFRDVDGPALRAACTVDPATVPDRTKRDPKSWHGDMTALIKTHHDHVVACDARLATVEPALTRIKKAVTESGPLVTQIGTKIIDLGKACAQPAQTQALSTMARRLQTEVFANAAYASLKNPANTQEFMAFDTLATPVRAQHASLKLAADVLRVRVLEWRAELFALQAGLGPEVLKELQDAQAEMVSGVASAKGASAAVRRTDGVVEFDTAGLLAVVPAYTPPAKGKAPDAGQAARLKAAAGAGLRQFLATQNIAADSEEMFDLSLKSKVQLAKEYAASQHWDVDAMTADQQAVAKAVGEGLFETMRALIPNKLVTQGTPELTLGGKTYGTPEFLGQGGLGRAMRYTDPTDGATIVVKTLMVQNENTRAELVKEIKVQQYLQGGDDDAVGRNNVVGLEGAVTDEDGNLHMVMEVVAGGDLEDNRMGMMIASQLDALPEAARSALQQATVKQAVEGLIYLRDQNVVHFDIKGANIFLAEDGTTKLADFGSSSVNTTADGGVAWDAPSTAGYDDGASHQGEIVDERFDIFSMGKVIQVMQNNTVGPDRSGSGNLTGAIKRLTQGMSAKDANERPTLEAVLESSYIKNLDAYDPADIKALQAKSVAYGAALRKEMAAVRAKLPPPFLAQAAAALGKTPDTLQFTPLCNYCRGSIDAAQKEIATLVARRDAPGMLKPAKDALQLLIEAEMAKIESMNDALALFGKSPAAQGLAAEMKEISQRMTRGAADVLNNDAEMAAMAKALKSADDPAGFTTVVTLPAYAKAFEAMDIDYATLRNLVAGYGLDVTADNANAAADVKALADGVVDYLAGFPDDDSVSDLRDAIQAGLLGIVRAVQARLADPALERHLGGLRKQLQMTTGQGAEFQRTVADPKFSPVFDYMGADQAEFAKLAAAYKIDMGSTNPLAAKQLDLVRKSAAKALAGLPSRGLAQPVAEAMVEGFDAMFRGLEKALKAATV